MFRDFARMLSLARRVLIHCILSLNFAGEHSDGQLCPYTPNRSFPTGCIIERQQRSGCEALLASVACATNRCRPGCYLKGRHILQDSAQAQGLRGLYVASLRSAFALSKDGKICSVRRMGLLYRDKSRGDELLSRLLRGEVGGGELENRLLAELHEGYPVGKLRLLLKAKDEKVVAAGMWLASELGEAARPLFEDIIGLIHHPSLQVGFFALDCLMSCVQPEDERAISLAFDLIDDPEPSLQWKALVFLATASDAVLRAARQIMTSDEPASVRSRGLELLLGSVASRDIIAITSSLGSSDAVLRRYAAAAAARMVHRDSSPLRQAMESADPTIKQFAADMAARAGITES